MARKDDMLNAFFKNQEFCKKFDITVKTDESIYQSLRSQSPIIVALAKIVDKYEDDNTTPLYQQIINLLNENL
jgi:hypothetical protein